jgi:hypothetical protein
LSPPQAANVDEAATIASNLNRFNIGKGTARD